MTSDWDEARRVAAAAGRARRAATESVPLPGAVGRILAEPVDALCGVPGFDTAAMDGWAVAGEGPWLLEAEIHIGDAPAAARLTPGTARPIATGAPVPPGETAVLRREHGEVVSGVLRLASDRRSPSPGCDVRRAGEEVSAGERILDPGDRLSPASVALAAVCGRDALAVGVPPSVDLLVVGGEVQAEGVPAPGRVRDAHGVLLPPVLAEFGARCGSIVRLGDDAAALLAAVAGSRTELLVTTGGTGFGPTDGIRAALAGAGCRLLVDGVAMRPGHPVLLAVRADGRPVLALPGNPFAALAALLALGGPLLDGMLGRPERPPVTLPAGEDLPNDRPAVRIVSCRVGSSGLVPTPHQGAAAVRGAAEADVLAVVPEGGVLRGQPVPVLPLPR